MSPVRRFPVPPRAPHDDDVAAPYVTSGERVREDESVLARLARLLRLEVELGLVESRDFLRTVAVAVAAAIVAAIALIAALVVLLAAAVSPIFHAPWQPPLIAGGGVALLSAAALGWSAWRLTHLSWPKETLTSLEENWRWLVRQLRSRLTSSTRAA
jgi:hypothetical protein